MFNRYLQKKTYTKKIKIKMSINSSKRMNILIIPYINNPSINIWWKLVKLQLPVYVDLFLNKLEPNKKSILSKNGFP